MTYWGLDSHLSNIFNDKLLIYDLMSDFFISFFGYNLIRFWLTALQTTLTATERPVTTPSSEGNLNSVVPYFIHLHHLVNSSLESGMSQRYLIEKTGHE